MAAEAVMKPACIIAYNEQVFLVAQYQDRGADANSHFLARLIPESKLR